MINLATKYSPKILTKWQKTSYLAGKSSDEYEFSGVRTIRIFSPQTVDLNDYNKNATANRFGTPVEMQDEVQEMTLTQDKSFAITIDKGNNVDQYNIKGAGKMMSLQLKEKSNPYMDKYAFGRWVAKAGRIVGVTALTKANIVTTLADALAQMDDDEVPEEGRYLYLSTVKFNMLRLSTEFQATPLIFGKVLERGVVGDFMGAKVVKLPKSYFPTNVEFLIAQKDAVMFPMKLKTLRILDEVAGLDGNLLEGRHYFDAFVLGKRCVGVYAGVVTGNVVADPIITPTGASHAVTAVGGVTFRYTTDGSDPRYSLSAQVYSTAVVLTSGQTIRVYGSATDKFDSIVKDAKYV